MREYRLASPAGKSVRPISKAAVPRTFTRSIPFSGGASRKNDRGGTRCHSHQVQPLRRFRDCPEGYVQRTAVIRRSSSRMRLYPGTFYCCFCLKYAKIFAVLISGFTLDMTVSATPFLPAAMVLRTTECLVGPGRRTGLTGTARQSHRWSAHAPAGPVTFTILRSMNRLPSAP